ncbi:MAG: T9SS type A sorting domain-containing protein [Bacteroidetes bacterium]|nr:T9SS type A sorting domain-containing protein [Bacteroidota bacterium]
MAINSAMDSRGSSCSISDTSGNLLFYASGSDPLQLSINETVKVRNALDQIMQNGDSIVGMIWYQELLITDLPASSNLFYLFSVGVSVSDGLYYSIVDMNANGGQGAVIQKNIQLESFKCTDGLTAVKHGNGRDWWIIFRRWDTVNNEYYKYLVTPAGISNVSIDHVGSLTNNGFGKMKFTQEGSKFAYINFKGMLEIYDFDRCTGIISNPVTIHPEPPSSPYVNRFWSCEFSANQRFLYVGTYSADSCFLFQYDLLNPDPANSRILLDSTTNNLIAFGLLKRGPDEKIYFSKSYQCQIFPYCFPYPDSVYNYVNMNLSVINSPDNLGVASNYTPFSFYLGGKRTYVALPNNPDYDLPALAGSPCDTLVSQNELAGAAAVGSLHVYYHPAWEKAFINASNLKGKTGKLLVYDIQGKVVHSEPLRIQNGYYTRDLSMIGRADGVYLVVVETEQERLVKKVLID